MALASLPAGDRRKYYLWMYLCVSMWNPGVLLNTQELVRRKLSCLDFFYCQNFSIRKTRELPWTTLAIKFGLQWIKFKMVCNLVFWLTVTLYFNNGIPCLFLAWFFFFPFLQIVTRMSIFSPFIFSWEICSISHCCYNYVASLHEKKLLKFWNTFNNFW